MKIILSTLNSKFIHSSLSIRYLQAYTRDIFNVKIEEFTINQNIDLIASELYKLNADIIGFSTYIWNLTETLQICEILKIVNPNLKIILGGPEVSFDGELVMENHPFIDYIIYGEGEETFRELLLAVKEKKENYGSIKGLIYRDKYNIVKNLPRPLMQNLNNIPSPYENIKGEFKNKIVYFESSRGCPFNCKFCLSSTIKGVRYFQIERVKAELEKLIEGEVKQVKFVDRTFNANKRYAMEIMNFIIEKDPKNINFHFEVTAHLLDEEMLEFLSNVKEGLFQFEIGVQSTNLDTIDAIGRTTDFAKLREISKRIKNFKNIHQHLDLIAGLPYEDYDTFKNSFNDVYEIGPEKIQLGFLKLLKGSELRINEKKYGFKYLDLPPYEILENDYISYKELIKLKGIEDLVEKYYNEGYFKNSINYMVKANYKTPFDFYEDFSNYFELKGYYQIANSRADLYAILLEFYKYKDFSYENIFIELVKFDFIENNKGAKFPRGIDEDSYQIQPKDVHIILKDARILEGPLYQYKDLPTKKTIKNILIYGFDIDILNLIEDEYNILDYKGNHNKHYILFVYTMEVINRCKTYDISKIVKELI